MTLTPLYWRTAILGDAMHVYRHSAHVVPSCSADAIIFMMALFLAHI